MIRCEARQLVDDGRVRVTWFDFQPGAETGWHEHGFDYVITAVTDCHMRLEEPGGNIRDVHVAARAMPCADSWSARLRPCRATSPRLRRQ